MAAGASRARYSMASLSPSQSDPLTVSYMCHCQLSGPIFCKDAAMPPCAATVWLRVGKTLVMQAVLKPCSAMPRVARRPAPPAPTTTTSNSWSMSSYCAMAITPEDKLEKRGNASHRDENAEQRVEQH